MKVVFNKSYHCVKNNFFTNKENKIFIKKFGVFYKVLKTLYIHIYKLLFKRKSQQILNSLENIERKIFFLEKKIEQSFNDLTLDKTFLKISMSKNYEVITDFPIALDSPDHLHPTGTAVDNTRSPSFVSVINNFFSKKIDHLDLGCAGGGLCYDFLSQGK